jgi:crossover junction endonuclease MUS81
MPMKITVDNREQELLKHISQLVLFIPAFKQLKVDCVNLPLGDIIISDENEEKIIIERKSMSDLLSSIKDGRYEEQSYRLNGMTTHNHNIYYLIEGDVNKSNRFKDTSMEKLTLYSAMFSLNYYKGFSVMRTFNMEESALFICNIANKLEKSGVSGKPPFYQNRLSLTMDAQLGDKESSVTEENVQQEQSDKDYVAVIKKIKKENITTSNIGEIMLCQIPGVSAVTSLAIMEKYKNLPNLIKEIEANKTCLDNISYINSKGQSRKITKTSIANVVKFLQN